MLLKYFYLFGEEGISDVSKSFSFQTRFITSLYERLFENYKTKDCKQLNFHCGEYDEIEIVECVDGFCEVLVPYDINKFLHSSDSEKKIQALELLKNSLDFVIIRKEWDPTPFQKVYNKIKELDYINEYTWNKPKWSPNKQFKAEVHCFHDLYEFTIEVVIKDKENKTLQSNKVISTKPDDLIFGRFLGELKWESNKEIFLYEKNSKRYNSVILKNNEEKQ